MFDINYSKLPEHMQGAARRYIEKGHPPGQFLTAVICNDLFKAVGHADEENQKALVTWVKFFYNEAPGECWRDKENMDAWMSIGGLQATS